MTACYYHSLLHTRTISHTKKFSRQPICQGIQFRSTCNVLKKFCTDKPGQKIYRCMSLCSTQHHTLLHNPTIIHTKKCFAPACNSRKIYRCTSELPTQHHTLLHNPTILHMKKFLWQPVTRAEKYVQDKTVIFFNATPTLASHVIVHFRKKSNSLGLGLGLQYNNKIAWNRYISLHKTTRFAYYFYFYVLCNLYHTNKQRVLLDNPYYSQVLLLVSPVSSQSTTRPL